MLFAVNLLSRIANYHAMTCLRGWDRRILLLTVCSIIVFLPLEQAQGGTCPLPSPRFDVNFDSDIGHVPSLKSISLGNGSPVDIEYDEATMILNWPEARSQLRVFWLKNNGNTTISNLYYGIKNLDENSVISGPAINLLRLDPGERLPIHYLLGWKQYFPGSACAECFDTIAGQEVLRNFSITVFQCDVLGQGGTCEDSTYPSATALQSNLLKVSGDTQLPLNSILSGTVTDQLTGQPVTDAIIYLSRPLAVSNPFTPQIGRAHV